jgi:proteasome accessory factor B
MAQRDPAERLLNLVIALSHARVRMTRAEIRATVEGYEPVDHSLSDQDAKRRDAAFERMFERDKDELRSMGIPLRTVTDAAHGDDIGYKIDPSDAALPPIDLTPAELALLSAAAELWDDASLGLDARQGVVKVASAAHPGRAEDIRVGARTIVGAAATAVLADAAHERQQVRFSYSSINGGLAVRHVQPWRILVRGGAEYVHGFDVDRGASRTFRIGRIDGKVATVGEPGAYTVPAELPAPFSEPTAGGDAVIALRPESGHALRARGTDQGIQDGWDVVHVPVGHMDALRDEVLALGGSAKVLEPQALADSVVAHALAAREVARG